MNHETLQALYALDVAEVGEKEAAKRWEMHNTTLCTVAQRVWTQPPKSVLSEMNKYPHLLYRRKPGIPWPKKIQPDLAAYKAEINRLQARLNQEQPKQEWPADAPEWANYMATDGNGRVVAFENEPSVQPFLQYWDVYAGRRKVVTNLPYPNWHDSLIERPKPVLKKIDWSKVTYSITRMWHPEHDTDNPLTGWIAWNCDEHTRGNPLPDGLVVEGYDISSEMPWTNNNPHITWKVVRCFRIVGIQEGWE